MTTAARRAEKREAQRENYAAHIEAETKREEEALQFKLEEVMIDDWEGNFTHDQQRALARMFMRLCK